MSEPKTRDEAGWSSCPSSATRAMCSRRARERGKPLLRAPQQGADIVCSRASAPCELGLRRRCRPDRRGARPAVHRPEHHRELHGLGHRRPGQPRPRGDHLRRGQPGRRARRKPNWNEYNQPSRSAHRCLRRDAGRQDEPGLVL